MKEQLYTIPVNDAFEADCECPVCKMMQELEENAIDFTMGPSYMEDDVRMVTNETGFCDHHIRRLYQHQNRLGLALVLHTHMQRTNEVIGKLLEKEAPAKKGLFSKKTAVTSPLTEYLHKVDQSCYICDRIDQVFQRYIVTIFHCYQKDAAFPDKIKNAKGFCMRHFCVLYEEAPNYLSGNKLTDFISDLTTSYMDNMKRVTDDLEWFTDKFDYKNENAPWKNAKDALPRSINKLNSILPDK